MLRIEKVVDTMKRTIFHIDMNAFFASCEQSRNPELKNKPIIVVGDPKQRRGIVLAASYEAKAFGIKTTMPIYQAKKLCPQVIAISSSHGLYSKISKEIMGIFDEYTPLKEQLSIDEAFLDMTGTEHLFGQPYDAAQTIQKRIMDQMKLGCSIGISTNKLLAKMASDMKKPMGITLLNKEDIEKKMWPMPVGELYGVGRKTLVKLNNLGIKTIGELAQTDLSYLMKIFGEKYAIRMHESSNGIGSDRLEENTRMPVKSIGNEWTYSEDLSEDGLIKDGLMYLSEKVAYRMRKKMLKAKTIQLKVKFNDFTVMTRSRSINSYTDGTRALYEVAWELFKENRGNRSVRLLGISVSNFEGQDGGQMSLFDRSQETKKVDRMMDELREKYGFNAIKRASLLEKKNTEKKKEERKS